MQDMIDVTKVMAFGKKS